MGLSVLAQAIWGSGPAWAGGMSQDLADQAEAYSTSMALKAVIVQSDGRINLGGIARAVGVRLDRNLSSIAGGSMRVPYCLLKRLAGLKGVKWISPDREIRGKWDNAPRSAGSYQVWLGAGFKGSGVRVAVLDSGVAPGSDFNSQYGSSRIAGWNDFVNGKPQPYDDYGHGTHVAGIAVGNGANSFTRFPGNAPEADLVACKVLDANGAGQVSTVISAIDWCVQNKSSLNIRVMNISLGCKPGESYTTDPLCAAVRRAVAAGIVVVCSAGNNGTDSFGTVKYGGICAPANDPSVITVGASDTNATAVRTDDRIAPFSSRGPTLFDNVTKPDLVAPGSKIVSVRAAGSTLDLNAPAERVDPASYGGTDPTPQYTQMNGTSMAAPQVAAAAAMMIQASPGLTPAAVKGFLMYSAQHLSLVDALGLPLTPGIDVLTQGAGELNASGAVQLARAADTGAALGSSWLRFAPTGRTTIMGGTFAWAGSVLYGGNLVSGTDLVNLRQALWSGATWGDPVSWSGAVSRVADGVLADQPIWTDQWLWTTTAVVPDQVIWGDGPPTVSAAPLGPDPSIDL